MSIEEALLKYGNGEIAKDDLLSVIAENTIYVPGIEENEAIRVATFSHEGKEIVPSFSTEENYESWGDNSYNCLPVFGADLAITLPTNVFLLIDPGKESYVELTPEDLDKLSVIASDKYEDVELNDDNKMLKQAIDDGGSFATKDSIAKLKATGIEKAGEQLKMIFVDLFKIDEAYIVPVSGQEPGIVLGILTSKQGEQKRFEMIEEIAKISRSCFGRSGAIEVYDDLAEEDSNSWELFKHVTPFYVKE